MSLQLSFTFAVLSAWAVPLNNPALVAWALCLAGGSRRCAMHSCEAQWFRAASDEPGQSGCFAVSGEDGESHWREPHFDLRQR
jgi:hypothetical protein